MVSVDVKQHFGFNVFYTEDVGSWSHLKKHFVLFFIVVTELYYCVDGCNGDDEWIKKNTKKHSFCFNMGRIHFIVCLMSEHVLFNNKEDPEVKHFAFI